MGKLATAFSLFSTLTDKLSALTMIVRNLWKQETRGKDIVSGNEWDSLQLIDGQGVFKEDGLQNFVEEMKLSERGTSYAVVSVIGPQSSGKSTLLNHLFDLNFRVMDADEGRNQTTQGIWLSEAVGIKPCTLVMDVEGTDGRERGEDDTNFERQSALFALAVSDIVLINMWDHDIGREKAASKPLLRTVFEVMMRLFSPRKTTLLFVIRDKGKSSLKKLEEIIRKDIQQIWNTVPKLSKYQKTSPSAFFNIEVTALSSYERDEEKFKKEVSVLRERISNSTAPGDLASDRRALVPGSDFPSTIKTFWEKIKKNNDLDLPAHKVMVATVRCGEIAGKMFDQFVADEKWRNLEKAAKQGPVKEFGKQVSAIIDTYFKRYDVEAQYYEESVRKLKLVDLKNNSLNHVYPIYRDILSNLCSKVLRKFKDEIEVAVNNVKGFNAAIERCTKDCMKMFDQGCADAEVKQADWNSTEIRNKLLEDLKSELTIPVKKIYRQNASLHEGAAYEAARYGAEAAAAEAGDTNHTLAVVSSAAASVAAIATAATTATAVTGGTVAPVAIPVAIAAAVAIVAAVPVFFAARYCVRKFKRMRNKKILEARMTHSK